MSERRSIRAAVSGIAAILLVAGLATPAAAAGTGIDGVITDAKTGAPVRGAWIQAHDSSGAGIGGAGTDDAGHYDIDWLKPGQYQLEVMANNYDTKWSDAPVTSPGTASFALAPYEYGNIAGSFVSGPGRPIAQAGVQLTDTNGNEQGRTGTDADGKFRFDRVKTGTYKIRFYWPDSAEQWWPQQTDPYQAGTITVTADKDTAVDETALPTGSLEMTVTDQASHKPISGACVTTRSGPMSASACADAKGKAKFPILRAGTYSFTVTAATYLFGSIDDVVVAADKPAAANTTLLKESILTVSFEDAATGAPVGKACVAVVDESQHGGVDPNHLSCTYGTGSIRLDGYWPGRYRLFAVPGDVANGDGVHGSQWVGAHGGTGDLEKAQWVELKSGATTGVRVRFDQAGSITGQVTDAAAGTPVSGVCPSVTPVDPWYNQPWGVNCTYTDGHYTINSLGPYDWRVQFADYTGKYAWSWSGDKPDRFAASPVRVTAGAPATLDARLKPAGTVTGKVVGATVPYQYVSVNAVNARTGDWAGPDRFVSATGEYSQSGLNTQDIRITFSATNGDPVWYPRPVHVVAGQVVSGLDLHVPPHP